VARRRHEGAIEAIVRETLLAGVAPPGDEPAIRAALEDLRVTSEAYRLHRARNVYNGAYVAWWTVAGAAWEARLARAVGS
jgi:alkylation response protein AidB-like acyl-CoA dehydrogenase